MSTSTKIKDFKINQLTEEQYKNAKANNELNENELYLTTDDNVSGDSSDNSFTYSTDEVFTGKYWIDGKKIYSKVFYTEQIPKLGTQEFDAPSNIKMITHMYGITNNLVNKNARPIPLADGGDASNTIRINYNGVTNKVTIQTWTTVWNGYDAHIIIEYTKNE